MTLNTTAKGKKYEQEIRRAFLDAGYPARRTPRSGATQFAKGDVQFDSQRVTADETVKYANEAAFWLFVERTRKIYTIECKRKKSLPSWITDCLKHDVVALRENGGKTVILCSLDTFLELMK